MRRSQTRRGAHSGMGGAVPSLWLSAFCAAQLALSVGCAKNDDGNAHECASTEYASDGACAPLTQCTAGEYEAAAATDTSDRVCAAITQCTNEEYEAAAATDTSDRVCVAITQCTAEEYEVLAPTDTSDRACRPLTVCAEEMVPSHLHLGPSVSECCRRPWIYLHIERRRRREVLGGQLQRAEYRAL